MKDILLYVYIVMTIVSIFCSCSDNETNNSQQMQTPAVLMGKAYTFDTEDVGEQWKSGKTIGVYMLKDNKVECLEPYCNVKYQTTVNPQGYFTPVNKDDVIFYPQDGSNVSIIGYYPWKETLIDEVYKFDVANQKQTSNFSFLYASNGKGLNKDNNKVELQFRPVLSQILFRLEAGDGVTDEHLMESEIKISGMNTKADFNLLLGIFENASTMKDIELLPLDEENGACGQILPSNSIEGYQVAIKLPKMERTFQWVLSEEIESLKQGMRYICSVKVNLDKIDVVTEEEAIKDWLPGEEHLVTGEENNIQTAIDELPLGVWTKSSNAMLEPMDTWCYQQYKQEIIDVKVELDKELDSNVIYGHFENSGGTWYHNFIAYKMGNAKPQIYTLSFRAKGTVGKKMGCYVKSNESANRNSNLFVVKNTTTGNAGEAQFTLSNSYEMCSIDFDFSQMVESASGSSVVKSTPTALANFYLAFYSSDKNTTTDFYLTDLIFKRKN
ncbi:fimbrillin family protein [uncultured Bacteroides sp.]|uniref:fimbrillin family protein n=1 Tax=uncultured Bacteroides sp. TaxID=162156 RepID=UPI0008222DF2|nr:fimbrillin family protein [uncultured Bacteroides sp.]SCH80262.1 Uncharacterised protein [uncultured Bacteroides sp.]